MSILTTYTAFLHVCYVYAIQGFFSGTYNAIVGKVKHDGVEIGEIAGRWSHSMEFKPYNPTSTPFNNIAISFSPNSTSSNSQEQAQTTRVLFDANSPHGKRIAEKICPPEDEQEPNESRRQWSALTRAILSKNMDAATNAKCAVEDAQREDRRLRDERGEKFVPRFFELRSDGRWEPKIQ